MKAWKLLWLLFIVGGAVVPMALCKRSTHDTRSVQLVDGAIPRQPANPPLRSAGVFIGIHSFADPVIAPVPYGADDAVDLAYVFAMEGKPPLIDPHEVILLLAGQPRKENSKLHLDELKAAGATIRGASKENILDALKQQASRVGKDGMLIAAFATHGYTAEDAVSYVLAEASGFQDPKTAISTAKVLEIAAGAPRSLVLLDACRDRVIAPRAGMARPNTAAPRLGQLKPNVKGQVAFFAAPAGGYAIDCDSDKNGCFTAAVIDGLHGKAKPTACRAITIAALQRYVRKRVIAAGKQHKPPVETDIQVNLDGSTSDMIVALCPAPVPNPIHADRSGSTLRVFAADRSQVWQKDLKGAIVGTSVMDLDGDGRNEVLAAVAQDGGGKIVAYDAGGDPAWEQIIRAPAKILINESRKTKREVVILSAEAEGLGSVLTVLGYRGKVLGSYPHPEGIRQFLFGRKTSHRLSTIIGTSSNRVLDRCAGVLFALNAKNGRELWYGCSPEKIRTIDTVDYDNNGEREIKATTMAGEVFYVDFEGHRLQGDVPFTLIPPKQRAKPRSAAGSAADQPVGRRRAGVMRRPIHHPPRKPRD